jgi:hypothetical protein
MRFSLVDSMVVRPNTSTICRISALGTRWRVMVESWEVGDGWRGRLVFEPDSPAAAFEPRRGPAAFRGRNQADVLDVVHQLPERRLRELLHALG